MGWQASQRGRGVLVQLKSESSMAMSLGSTKRLQELTPCGQLPSLEEAKWKRGREKRRGGNRSCADVSHRTCGGQLDRGETPRKVTLGVWATELVPRPSSLVLVHPSKEAETLLTTDETTPTIAA